VQLLKVKLLVHHVISRLSKVNVLPDDGVTVTLKHVGAVFM